MFGAGDIGRNGKEESQIMITMIRSSIKLLFRAKAFWFFLLIVPFLATLMLKSKMDSSMAYVTGFEQKVQDLSNADEKVAYFGGKGEYLLKVYDASDSELSSYLLDKVAKTGMILAIRADVTNEVKNGVLDKSFIEERLAFDGEEDRMGAVLVIAPDFDDLVLSGRANEAIDLYALSDDERTKAVEGTLSLQLSRMESFKNFVSVSGDKETANDLLELLKEADENLPKKEIVSISGSGKETLTKEQTNLKTNIGYSFVFLTLAYVFCGIFVAYNAITEQKNGVTVRVDLSGTSQAAYFLAKFVTVVVTTVLVTAFAVLYGFIMGVSDFGMERVKYYALVFLMGLIFGSVSMLIGILAGDVMSSTIAAFTIWCMSSMLSGMYFPIKYTTVGLKILSYAMPQKWFITAVEMIFVKDNNVFVMIICVTVAYILAILSIGALGLKMKRTEEWGTN